MSLNLSVDMDAHGHLLPAVASLVYVRPHRESR